MQNMKPFKQLQGQKGKTKRKQGLIPVEALTSFELVREHDFHKAAKMRNTAEQENKQKLKRQQKQYFMLSYIHFRLIQHYCQDIVINSIKYLKDLASLASPSRRSKKWLTIQSISENFFHANSKQSFAFVKQSTNLLNKEILRIAKHCEEDLAHHKQFIENNNIQIKIQIMAFVLKAFYFFNEYILSEGNEPVRFKLSHVYKHFGFSNEQFKTLKRVYRQNQDNIEFLQFLEPLYNIRNLINTHYLIHLKKRICLHSDQQEPQEKLVTDAIQKIKLAREQKQKPKGILLEDKHKTYLSNIFQSYLRSKAKYKTQSLEEFTQVMRSFEYFISHKQTPTIKHALVLGLKERFNINPTEYCRRFKRYKSSRRNLTKIHGLDLRRYKNAIINHFLISNPDLTYERLHRALYKKAKMWIDQPYFDMNFHEILKNQVRYQQDKFIGRLINGISHIHQEEGSIGFIGCLNFNNKGYSEHPVVKSDVPKEPNIIIVATLSGQVFWNFTSEKVSTLKIFYEASRMTRHLQDTILLYCDAKFPIISQEEEGQMKKYVLAYCLPKRSALLDPIEAIGFELAMFKQNKACQSSQDYKDICEEFFNRAKSSGLIKRVMLSQWQKARRYVEIKGLGQAQLTKDQDLKLTENFGSQSLSGAQMIKNQEIDCFPNNERSISDQPFLNQYEISQELADVDNKLAGGEMIHDQRQSMLTFDNFEGKGNAQLQVILKRLLHLNNIDLFYHYRMSKKRLIKMSYLDFIKINPQSNN